MPRRHGSCGRLVGHRCRWSVRRVRYLSSGQPQQRAMANIFGETRAREIIGMSGEVDSIIDAWRKFGSATIPENFHTFKGLLANSEAMLREGCLESAAIYAAVAAFHASVRHCGVWSSSKLERILLDIGRKAVPVQPNAEPQVPISRETKTVCHVVTSVMAIGGLSKMLWRWTSQDKARCHSLVLSKQSHHQIPLGLRAAVEQSGGGIHHLDAVIGSLLERARRLREIAALADIVVLHVHPDDVLPSIAFASRPRRPSVVYLDHADHSFWVGAGVSDVVANMRETGARLSRERRGIDAGRIALLPTVIEPSQRILSRVEAKRRLGLPGASVVLLSVARARKYRSFGGATFADSHLAVLDKHQNAILVVVGPGRQEDWSDAVRRTGGRIITCDECDDPSQYFQAADIYVDSFPFVSITSLLEAGSYGTPLVSRFPYGDACGILGADMPGLTGTLMRVRSPEEYVAQISRLIEDERLRERLGEQTREQILKEHTRDKWLESLQAVYDLARSVGRLEDKPLTTDRMFVGEPDVFMQSIHDEDRRAESTDTLIQLNLPLIPLRQRLRLWLDLARHRRLQRIGRYGPMVHLLPAWLTHHVGRQKRRLLARGAARRNGDGLGAVGQAAS